METIKIKYHNKKIEKIKKIENGDWIDLRAAQTVVLLSGEFRLISLGVSMVIPDGYEANIVLVHLHSKTSGLFRRIIWGWLTTLTVEIMIYGSSPLLP